MLRQSTINRNSPTSRFHRNHQSSGFQRGNNTSSSSSSSSSSSANFIYRGADKQQWSKLIGLIEQKFMAKDIGYLDDEEEVASRKIPPPSPIFLEPPMHAEDPRDRDIRLRQQLLIDEERKLAATTTKDYKEKFASDYPKAIAIIYSLVSETIRKDLSRAVENAVPPITNNETKYRKIRERLQDKWGPNSQKRCRRTPPQTNQPPGRRPRIRHLSHRPR
jgi:hypothetical protein